MFYVYNSNKINILCINYVFFIKKKNSVSCPVKTIFLVLFFIQMSGRFFFENFKYRYMSVNPEKASRTLFQIFLLTFSIALDRKLINVLVVSVDFIFLRKKLVDSVVVNRVQRIIKEKKNGSIKVT